MPLDLVSTTDEKVHVHIAPTTSTGKPAEIQNAEWSITSGR